ncbi:hypothetical protein HanIR_Chr02g0089521 [Helianthus annuus]|nr:hypothetical protein HanIR_Chr02g0089521 [Helianthus annuus]
MRPTYIHTCVYVCVETYREFVFLFLLQCLLPMVLLKQHGVIMPTKTLKCKQTMLKLKTTGEVIQGEIVP